MNRFNWYLIGKYLVGVGSILSLVGLVLINTYEDYRPREYVQWAMVAGEPDILGKVTSNKNKVEARAFDGIVYEENVRFYAQYDKRSASIFSSCSPTTGPIEQLPETGPAQKDDWWYTKVQGEMLVNEDKAESISICGIDSGFSPHPDIKVDGSISMTGGSVADLVGHGSATLSVMAGLDNSIGIRGISKAKLYMCKALGDDGSGSMDWIARCVQWCSESTPAKVINMSLGGPQGSQLLYQTIAQARAKGIYVIAAAGNAGTSQPNYPAAFDTVISVSATTINDTLARFSSYGKIQYAAPGENVLVAVPKNANMCNGSSGYCVVSGTSFSSPLTAGICAIALAKGKSCDNLGVDNIGNNTTLYGLGRVNAKKTSN